MKKGSGIKVDFTVRPNKFEKDGVTHYTNDLVVERFNILSDPAEEA